MPRRRKISCKTKYVCHQITKRNFDLDSTTSSSSDTCDLEIKRVCNVAINPLQTSTIRNVHSFSCDGSDHVRFLTSSPIPFDEMNADTCLSSDVSCSTLDSDTELYRAANISVKSFSSSFMSIVSKHNISDNAASDFLDCFAASLPIPNTCPSLYNIRTQFSSDSDITQKIPDGNGHIYLLRIEEQISSLLTSNPEVLLFSPTRKRNDDTLRDITDGTCFQWRNMADNVVYLYVALNCDGVQPVHKSKCYHLWPVLLSVFNLSPLKRRQFKNMVLCAIFYGSSKPNFSKLMEVVATQLSTFLLIHEDYQVKIHIQCIVADLPAKSAILNVTQFNGYYSCLFCLIKGTYDNQLHKMIFPIENNCAPRTHSNYQENAITAIQTGKPQFGIKGYCFLKSLVNPIQSPLDVMHLVYLGVTKTLTMFLIKHKLIPVLQISTLLLNVRVPVSFQRKPRSLIDAIHWKAQEWKYFLFYYAVVLFYEVGVDNSIVELYLLLSTAIYILSSSEVLLIDISFADNLLIAFQQLLFNSFGNSAMSYSIHSLTHLPKQVSMYGPLWTTSASCFESAFSHLKAHVTGTKNEASIIIKRYLRSLSVNKDSTPRHNKMIDVNGVVLLGRIESCNLSSLQDWLPHFPYNISNVLEVYRIIVKNVIYHSTQYALKKQSRSYLAIAMIDNITTFVKINRIVYSIHQNEFLCMCSSYVQAVTSRFNVKSVSASLYSMLHSRCHFYELSQGGKCVISAKYLMSNFIFISGCYAVPVLVDNEHD